MSYGSGGGTGSSDHLTGELFALMAGVTLQHVPYKSGPQAVTDLIGGQITIYMGGVPVNLPMIKSGKLKPLGVSSLKRIAQLPEVPTIAEAGRVCQLLSRRRGQVGQSGKGGQAHGGIKELQLLLLWRRVYKDGGRGYKVAGSPRGDPCKNEPGTIRLMFDSYSTHIRFTTKNGGKHVR